MSKRTMRLFVWSTIGFIVCITNVCKSDARVFCQDTNAAPRVSLGFTCPVVCASIQNAIDRLIMQDYKSTVKEQLGQRPKAINRIINHENDYADDKAGHDVKFQRNFETGGKIVNRKENIRTVKQYVNVKEFKHVPRNIKTYIDNSDEKHGKDNIVVKDNIKSNFANNIPNFELLENIKDVKGILRRSTAANKTEVRNDNIESDGKCWYLEKFKEKLLIGKIVRKKCSRRSNFDGKFVTIMTDVLNKYVNTIFRFTDEMTEILLENIFGRNVDLRNNIFDVNKLLHYLRKSVDRHRVHSHNQVITLRSKHCLKFSMPGCFCRSGYVESSGQCVKPEDCITNEKYMPYLQRIIIL